MSTALEPVGAPADAVATLPNATRRRELAAFLRNRRERLTPQGVGLPITGRRRTPGLRREEVAQLAGVGVTWYTWLEQGRDIRPSEQVLAAVARTLQLDPYEAAHLFTLAGLPARPSQRDDNAVPPGVVAMLERIDPWPAVVANARTDILAYNRGYNWLFGDVDELPFEERNTTLQSFLGRWEKRMPDWHTHKARSVAQLRASMADHMADPRWKALIKRLRRESADFDALWSRHDVTEPRNLTKRFLHPDAGLLQFHTTYLWLTPSSEIRMATYTPADADTAGALAALRL
ncbi:helix-turn-helix transcriptional regulator [Pseudonocardia adelaidensis]|uniref:Helix-turn-helix transcriptional regulator n=1 Tax=Pseudonocardia adelaidensis TaxID=648754 RepID=A0ABP9NRW0_9PSEU